MQNYRCIAIVGMVVLWSADAVAAQDASAVAGETASTSASAASIQAGSTGAVVSTDSVRVPVQLSLDDALARALEESEEVRVARARVDAAKAEVKGARSGALPRIDTQLGYTRTLRSVYQNSGLEVPDSLVFSPDPNAPLEERVRYLEQHTPTAGLGGIGSIFGNLPFGQENA